MKLLKRDEIFIHGNPRLIKSGVSVKNCVYEIDRRVDLPLTECSNDAYAKADSEIGKGDHAESCMKTILGEHTIYPYHSTPPITRVLCDRKDNSMGMELEMVSDLHTANYDTVYQLVTGNWYNFFHDGSLPPMGEELVTTCLPEKLAMQPELWNGLTDVLHLIFTAWKCSNCGLHVHCGRDFFESYKYDGIPYDDPNSLNDIPTPFTDLSLLTNNSSDGKLKFGSDLRLEVAELMLVYLYHKVVPTDMKFDVFKRIRTYLNDDIVRGYASWLDVLYDYRQTVMHHEPFLVSLMKIIQLRYLCFIREFSGSAYDTELSKMVRKYFEDGTVNDPTFKSVWDQAVENGMKTLQLHYAISNDDPINHGVNFADLRKCPSWLDPYTNSVRDSMTQRYHEDRYREVNLVNTDTIEFRLGKATVNAESILCMIEFCRLLMRYTGTRMLTRDFDDPNMLMRYIIHETTSVRLNQMANERLVQ